MPKLINLFSLVLKISGEALTSLRNFGNMKNLVFSGLRNIFLSNITWFYWFQEIWFVCYRNFNNRLRFFITISYFIRTTWRSWLFLISADPIIRNIRCSHRGCSNCCTCLRNHLRGWIVTLWNLKSRSCYLNLSGLLNVLIQNFVFFLDLL